jgi:hypothetical protein
VASAAAAATDDDDDDDDVGDLSGRHSLFLIYRDSRSEGCAGKTPECSEKSSLECKKKQQQSSGAN